MVRGVLLPMVVLEHLHALAVFYWQVRRTRDTLLDVADHRIGPFGEEHACTQQASTKHGANPHSMGCLESGNLSRVLHAGTLPGCEHSDHIALRSLTTMRATDHLPSRTKRSTPAADLEGGMGGGGGVSGKSACGIAHQQRYGLCSAPPCESAQRFPTAENTSKAIRTKVGCDVSRYVYPVGKCGIFGKCVLGLHTQAAVRD